MHFIEHLIIPTLSKHWKHPHTLMCGHVFPAVVWFWDKLWRLLDVFWEWAL